MVHQGRRWITFVVVVVAVCWGVIQAPMIAQPDADSGVDDVSNSAVQIGPITVFEVQSDLGSFSKEERADAISQRLLRWVRDNNFNVSQIQAKKQDQEVVVVANDQVILVVTPEDAQKAGQSPEKIAEDYIRQIKAGAQKYRLTYGRETLLTRGLIAGGITLFFLLLLTFLQWFVPRIHRRIYALRGHKIRPFKIQSLELLSQNQIAHVLVAVVNGIKFFVRLGLIYLYLMTVLSLFPWTQAIAQKLVFYVVVAIETLWAGFLDYLPNLIFVVIISAITFYVLRVIQFLCSAVERGLLGFPGFDREWARPTYQILRFLVLAVAVSLSIPYLPGSSSPAVQGMSIFFGILVSLGSTAVAANVVAGLALTYTRAFRIGDRVKIADTVGDVMEKTFLVTQIRTPKNMVVTIPNGMVLGDQIINYSANEKDEGLILHTQITLGYDVPWQKVHRVLIEAAIATEGVLNDPEPFVLQKGLEDFYVAYELNAYTRKPTESNRIYSELHQNIQDACNANDIEILSPHYSAVRDGNETTIPESYRGEGYQPPSFRLQGFNLFPKVTKESQDS